MISNFDLPTALYCLVICFVLIATYIVMSNKANRMRANFLMEQKSKERRALMTDNLESFKSSTSETNRDAKNYISKYSFPKHAVDKVAKKHNLSDGEMQIVVEALKEYLILSKLVKGKPLAMPSLVVDDLWHEFILCTKAYREFCDVAFGFYLDHNPSVPGNNSDDEESLARVWHASCLHNDNRLRQSKYASTLFTVDYSLGITPINHSLTMLDTMGMLDVSKLSDKRESHAREGYSSDGQSKNNSSDFLMVNASSCGGASNTIKSSSGKDNGGSQSSCSSSSTSDSKSSCSSASSCSSCGGGGGGD